MTQGNETPNITQARLELALQESTLKSFQEEHGQLLRWEIATLLAINSGAIIAVVNHPQFSKITTVYVLAFFIAGVVFAISLSTFGQLSLQQNAKLTQRRIKFHISTISTGQEGNRQLVELSINSKISKLLSWSYYPIIFGSLGSFITGCVLLLIKIEEYKNSLNLVAPF